MTGILTFDRARPRRTRFTPTFVLRLDATVSGVTGLAMLALAAPLGDFLDLPVGLLRGAGAVLLVLVAGIFWLAGRSTNRRAALNVVAGINVVWAIDSVVLLLTGWVEPNALGIAFVLFQAAVVLLLAELQILTARRIGMSPAA